MMMITRARTQWLIVPAINACHETNCNKINNNDIYNNNDVCATLQ